LYLESLIGLVGKLDTEAAQRPAPGRVATFRRLNRNEYQYAIRDLLGVEMDVRSLLPADEISHGFDNVTVGDLPPALLEKYLAAARKVSRLAVGTPVKAPDGLTVSHPPDLTQEGHLEGLPLGTRGGLARRFPFPVDAEYEIVVRLARDRNEQVEGLKEPTEVEILLNDERLLLKTVDLPPPGQDHSLVDQDLRVKVRVPAGSHVVAAAFPRKPTLVVETERQPLAAHFNMDRHPRLTPAIYSVTVNGPFGPQATGSSPARRKLFVCQPAKTSEEVSCAETILAAVTRRAFRRPVAAADYAHAMNLFREARLNSNFEEAIELALRRVLVSPEFLFRIEADPPGQKPGSVYRLNPFALASRLSFFLWSSIPDEALLRAAENGTLETEAGLEREVKRMLADSKAQALTENFAGQWLYLRNLESMLPDMRIFSDFDDNLRQAFRRETESHFDALVREDRSVLELIRTDHTYVNERLAYHYGIPNIKGSRFRKVALPPGMMRGGLLRQGSIHLVTSYPNRTSPVIRGKWILENLLGITPPPPPPNVPALEETEGTSRPKTVRERLAEHRKNPACSSCHNLMDPIGFALEHYDGVGRWRDVEVPDTKFVVDAEGMFPDGRQFYSVDGLEEAILARPEMFVTTLAEKLMTYALGRGVEASDAPAIRKIVREAAGRDGDPVKYKFSSIIIGIAKSTPFQLRSAT
jgi:hypothetical protein